MLTRPVEDALSHLLLRTLLWELAAGSHASEPACQLASTTVALRGSPTLWAGTATKEPVTVAFTSPTVK